MSNLIKNEININMTILILCIILNFTYAPVILLSRNEAVTYFIFIFVIMLTNRIFNNAEIVSENKNNVDLLMTSLPIVRGKIVRSKYIFYVLYSVFFNVSLFALVNILNKYTFLREIGNLGDGLDARILLYSLSICLIYFGIVRPLYYSLEENYKIVEYILFLFLFAIPKIMDLLTEGTRIGEILHTTSWGLAAITFIISLIMYFISLNISVSIYNKREF